MKKTFFFYMLFIFTVIFFYSASGQGVFGSLPGAEASALFLYDAEFAPVGVGCNSGFVNPCFESDGGYNPTVQGNFAGYFSAVSPFLSTNGNFVNWQITGNSQCIADIEFCSVNGELVEALCGNSIGLNSGNFNAVFPGNIWLGTEPAALAIVNCSVYAMNNPWLGLQGVCLNGACV